jgi:hypothetical protein
MAPRKTFQNAALLILGISACFLVYLVFHFTLSPVRLRYMIPPVPPQPYVATTSVIDTRPELDDPYNPPLVYPEVDMPIVAVHQPINVRTNGMPTEYRQLGILTRSDGPNKLILPLMGRSLQNGRDKWQYYTMSNSPGAAQTRLPISVNGRSCTSEYGCDSISNGDVVYVEGYDETFRATLYETGLFSYLYN